MKFATSPQAIKAFDMLTGVQSFFADHLTRCHRELCNNHPETFSYRRVGFEKKQWQRNQGKNGGGFRLQGQGLERSDITKTANLPLFNRASINFSQVHYEQDESKKLESATAVSTIIHPHQASQPSVHIHTSYTELKNQSFSFRVMADLNPSFNEDFYRETFASRLRSASGEFEELGVSQGNAYFNIPFLNMTRGVSHFYLENLLIDKDFNKSLCFAESFTKTMMQTYCDILLKSFSVTPPAIEKARTPVDLTIAGSNSSQIAYHSAYFAQVLLLDRGTTSGLLAHDQNDVGIMGSIPAILDLSLLEKWTQTVLEDQPIQKKLLTNLIDAASADRFRLDESSFSQSGRHYCFVDEEVKSTFAQVAREFYTETPEALKFQAKGFTLPETYTNHK